MTHTKVLVDDLSVQLALALGPEIKTEQEEPDSPANKKSDDGNDEMAPPVENDGDKASKWKEEASLYPTRFFSCKKLESLNMMKQLARHVTTGHRPADPKLYQPQQPAAQELLMNAAKARIRRMVTPKSKRTDLSVPAWVATEWNKGTKEKEQMATTLQEVNFDKAGPKSKPNFNIKLGWICSIIIYDLFLVYTMWAVSHTNTRWSCSGVLY